MLFEDIQDYVFQFTDESSKLLFIDWTTDTLGLGPVIYRQKLTNSIAFQELATDSLKNGNCSLCCFDKLIVSPYLKSFATFLTSVTERDMNVAQVSKFEFCRRIVETLRKSAFQASPLIRHASFVLEYAKTKSLFYLSVFRDANLDVCYKDILKGNQKDHYLWVTFVELEVMFEQTDPLEKWASLSTKVLKSFQGTAAYKSIRVSFLDIFLRCMPHAVQADSPALLKRLLDCCYSLMEELKTNTSSFGFRSVAPEKLEAMQEVASILGSFALDFLTLHKLTYNMVTSYLKHLANEPAKNTIDASFINKKLPYELDDFSCCFILWVIFGVLSQKIDEELILQVLQSWLEVHRVKLKMTSNVYARQYLEQKVHDGLEALVLLVNSVKCFMRKVLPGCPVNFEHLFAAVYKSLLPGNLSVLDILIEETVKGKFNFEVISSIRKNGMRGDFPSTLATVYKLRKMNGELYRNLTDNLLRQTHESSILDSLLEDQRLLIKSGEGQLKPACENGFELLSHFSAYVSLQSLHLSLDPHANEEHRRSLALSLIHRFPFSKVALRDQGILSGVPESAPEHRGLQTGAVGG